LTGGPQRYGEKRKPVTRGVRKFFDQSKTKESLAKTPTRPNTKKEKKKGMQEEEKEGQAENLFRKKK